MGKPTTVQIFRSCPTYSAAFFTNRGGMHTDAVEKAFGPVEPVQVEGVVETAFVTGIMSEKEYHAAADQFDTILNMIRIDV